MSLKYALIENSLTPDPNDYYAQPKDVENFTMDQIINKMTTRGSTVTKADTLSVMEVFTTVVEEIIRDGGSINTEIFNTTPSITGTFDGQSESFKRSKHQIHLNINPGLRLQKAVEEISTERVATIEVAPNFLTITDHVSGTNNQTLTPNGVLEIVGSHLKVQGNDPAVGLYFIDGSQTETKATILVSNQPSKVIAMIPALAKGTYFVEIRTQIGGSKNVKISRFSKTLIV